jgi:5-methylcytosine-specific restriction protein A
MAAKAKYHTSKRGPLYNKVYTNKQLKAFYNSIVWIKLRRLHLTESPYCVRCYRAGLIVLAHHVHHVKDVRTHPELSLDNDNLESLCSSHHNTHTRHEQIKNARKHA